MAQSALVCAMTLGPFPAPDCSSVCPGCCTRTRYSSAEGRWWPGLAITNLPTGTSSKAERRTPLVLILLLPAEAL